MYTWWQDLLMAILNCGVLDLNILKDADCDWDEIIEELKYGGRELNFNNLVMELFDEGLSRLECAIENKKDELNEDDEEEAEILAQLNKLNVYEDFDYFLNYIDTHLSLVENEDIYRKYLSEELEELENFTGFNVE